MLRNLSTLVLLLVLATPLAVVAQSTGKIAGRVVDDLGDPLPGANVFIEGTQLGTATDINGDYFIIGIPVGEYDLTASFVGYESQTVTGLQISSGYTTEQNFELGGTTELDGIEIVYERPIIQKDAIGVPKVVTGEQIENLPIRDVTDVAAIQSGAVANDTGSGDELFFRGGRDEEVAFYVDGVKVSTNARVGVNPAAIQEQEVLIGTIPARYGDVQSGVISITTKSGSPEFFGSAEIVTSEVLDSYGYNIGSLSIGGPLVPKYASFFITGQYSHQADRNPYGTDILQLSDADFDALQLNPQVVELSNSAGDVRYVNFPVTEATAAFNAGEDFTPEDLRALLNQRGDLADGFTNIGATLVSAPETFTSDRFERQPNKSAPLAELTINGNTTVNLGSAVSLRLGGGFERFDEEEYDYSRGLYSRDRFYHDEADSYRVYGTFRQRLSDNAFYQIQGEFQDWNRRRYPNGFSDDVRDVARYSDLDDPINATELRYFQIEDGSYIPRAALGGGVIRDDASDPVRAAGVAFQLPGQRLDRYIKQHDTSLRFSGSATTQLGLHQIEFGGEYQQETRRTFDINGIAIAQRIADGNVETGEGVASYGDLPEAAFPFDGFDGVNTRFGYDVRGINEVDDEDIDAYFNVVDDENGTRENSNIAPYKPIYYAGYIQDKIEYRDLVINLGLRVDVFDNNTTILKDYFAAVPILRADATQLGDPSSDLYQGEGFSLPNGIDSDYAVYFNDGGVVTGYRDLDGNFFDAFGQAATRVDIVDTAGAQVREDTSQPLSSIFEDYSPQVTFMPRVGVSFPVTDRALFFASYNVTSQRPTEFAFNPFGRLEGLSGQDQRTPNSGLEPERTTQYELGFRQRVGERAAVTLSGFYRTQDNKISNRPVSGGFPGYGTYLNEDFTTTKGAEFEFDLRRTNNLAINANYTLSFAQGTGSDATSTGALVWRGNFFPTYLSPSDFDQRHTINGSVDYRLGEEEGPMVGGAYILENFGVNILGQFGSGQRYTALVPDGGLVTGAQVVAEGTTNSETLPSNYRLDLQVDRRFNLGFAGAQAKIYLTVLNLLDTQNVLAVYRATGVPETDGYLGSGDRFGGLPNAESLAFNYSEYVGGPEAVGAAARASNGTFLYSQPRRFRLGLLLDF